MKWIIIYLYINYIFRIKHQISKEGLGLKSNFCSTNDLKFKCNDILRKYLTGDMRNDLIFSTDFTNAERAIIHQ